MICNKVIERKNIPWYIWKIILKKLNILIVEDESITALFIKYILEQRGYVVLDIISSGEEAIKLSEEIMPDLILMDITLDGEIDGISAAEEINSKLGIPVIFLTSHSDEDTLNRAKAVEPYGYILKPVYEDNLYSTIVTAYYKYEIEKKLKVSEKNLSKAQSIASLGNFEWDIESGSMIWSHELYRIFGLEIEKYEIDYNKLLEMIHPDDRYFYKKINRVLIKDGQGSFEFRIKKVNGDVRWLYCEGEILHDEKGESVKMFGILQDVTEKKVARFEKDKVFMELDQVFNSSVSGMCLIDRDFNFFKVNKKFFDLTGLKKSEITGKKCYEILNNDMCRTADCVLRNILSGKEYFEHQLKMTVSDDIHIFLIRGVPFLSPGDEVAGAIVNFIDVTETKMLEREIMKIAEEERCRIGHDLHDGLGQNITGLSFMVEVLKKKKEKNIEIEMSELINIENKIRDAIVQTQSIARGLCPVEMEKNGLIAALEEMADNTEKIYNIECRVNMKGTFFIDEMGTAINLFYIAREAINNSLKYSMGTMISIDLIPDDDKFLMSIKDNGNGISKDVTDNKSQSGLGLRIMNYRAGIIGASLEINNEKDTGFSVNVQVKK